MPVRSNNPFKKRTGNPAKQGRENRLSGQIRHEASVHATANLLMRLVRRLIDKI
jgi:hypothetical protein